MSESENGAICVRKDVMDKFHVIMDETKLDANELMEHLINLHNCSSNLNPIQFSQQQMLQQQQPRQNQSQVKTETDQSFLQGGFAFNASMSSGGSKNSSLSESDEVTCLGVTEARGDCSADEKVNLLQKLRENASHASSDGSGGNSSASPIAGGFQGFSSFSGPPSMVPLPNVGNFYPSPPKKKKKKSKKNKLMQSPVAQSVPISGGEDLLKSSMCSLCQAVFARFTDLLAHHKAVHNSDTNHPLRCRACGRTQTSEAGLIYHQVYVCKMVERPHPCHVCGLKFQTEEMVLVHKCSGCPRKKYACEFCDHYRSESSSDLEKHMRIHTNDKCYVCRACGFSTAWKKNLKEHMVKHLGLKPYSCDLCGYSTSDRHNLRAHRVKHYQKGEGCQKCGPTDCTCKPPGSGAPSRKRKLALSGGDPGAPVVIAAKDLECPYPQCVYRTKIEYMMANHMLRHQGLDQNLANPTGSSSSGGGSGSSGSGAVAVVGRNSVNFNSGGATVQHQHQQRQQQHQHQDMKASQAAAMRGATVMYVASSSAPVIPASSAAVGVSNVNQASNNTNNSVSVGTGQQATLIASSQQVPIEWKSLGPGQAAVAVAGTGQATVAVAGLGGVLSPQAAHFSPLVGAHQQGAVLQPAAMAWASPLSPSPGVPAAILGQRVGIPVAAQNMVARPMPVFPNMPN